MGTERRALPLMRVNHISRVVADVEKTAQFYHEVLGFVEIKRPSCFDFEGRWLFQYGIGIHLIEGVPLLLPKEIDPKADHLSFQSAELNDVEMRLAELGIEFVKDSVVENGVRVTQLFFHDPDHHMIEVCNCDCLPITPLFSGQLVKLPSGQLMKHTSCCLAHDLVDGCSQHGAFRIPASYEPVLESVVERVRS